MGYAAGGCNAGRFIVKPLKVLISRQKRRDNRSVTPALTQAGETKNFFK
jgi:hypothetical protein